MLYDFLTRIGVALIIGGAFLFLVNPQIPFALMMILGVGALFASLGLRSEE